METACVALALIWMICNAIMIWDGSARLASWLADNAALNAAVGEMLCRGGARAMEVGQVFLRVAGQSGEP